MRPLCSARARGRAAGQPISSCPKLTNSSSIVDLTVTRREDPLEDDGTERTRAARSSIREAKFEQVRQPAAVLRRWPHRRCDRAPRAGHRQVFARCGQRRPVERRRNSGFSRLASSARTCRLTAPGVTPSSSAARVTERWRAAASNARIACRGGRRRQDMALSITQR
jgi:hypothetical protein